MTDNATHRRRFQFSLRSLLAGVTLIAVLSAWGGPEAKRRFEEYRWGNDFDQRRPPLSSIVVEIYGPDTGTTERWSVVSPVYSSFDGSQD